MSDKKKRIRVDPNISINETILSKHLPTANRQPLLKGINKARIYFPGPYMPMFGGLQSEPKRYLPTLYTFRVKIKSKISKQFKNIPSKAPPFQVLFDHTLAVVWSLFSKTSDKIKSLGINQLQWARHFLKTIFNNDGVHPKDVQLVINTIEDYLVAEYSELSEESAVYATTKFDGPVGDMDSEQELPFSVNYAQMIDRCPEASAEETDSEIFDKELMDELENVKMIVGIESVDLSKVASKEQVMSVLTDMQKEQIEKITNEVKTLYLVEDMMKNTDTQNFKGYTDEKQFETLFKRS